MVNSEKNGNSSNPNRRRNDYDMMVELLELMEDPIKKTRLVYGVNSNFAHTAKYLSRMIEYGLVVEIAGNPSVRYQRTEKGGEFLKKYNELMELLA